MTGTQIIEKLPYTAPFLFVDEITEVSEQGISGFYTFKEDEYFYKGHFKGNPITPGVILTECMAQIGLVSLGIYLIKDKANLDDLKIAFTQADVQFLKAVFPKEKVKVISDIEYFRFKKIKCKVKLFNSQDILVCEAVLAGMISV